MVRLYDGLMDRLSDGLMVSWSDGLIGARSCQTIRVQSQHHTAQRHDRSSEQAVIARSAHEVNHRYGVSQSKQLPFH